MKGGEDTQEGKKYIHFISSVGSKEGECSPAKVLKKGQRRELSLGRAEPSVPASAHPGHTMEQSEAETPTKVQAANNKETSQPKHWLFNKSGKLINH